MKLQDWCADHAESLPKNVPAMVVKFGELAKILEETEAVLQRIEDKFDLTSFPKLAARISNLRARIQKEV